MKQITKRERILEVLTRWQRQYPTGKELITERLKELDLSTASEQEVKEIIGNGTWTELNCYECEKNVEVGAMFEYGEDSFMLCRKCLKTAIAVIDVKD